MHRNAKTMLNTNWERIERKIDAVIDRVLNNIVSSRSWIDFVPKYKQSAYFMNECLQFSRLAVMRFLFIGAKQSVRIAELACQSPRGHIQLKRRLKERRKNKARLWTCTINDVDNIKHAQNKQLCSDNMTCKKEVEAILCGFFVIHACSTCCTLCSVHQTPLLSRMRVTVFGVMTTFYKLNFW